MSDDYAVHKLILLFINVMLCGTQFKKFETVHRLRGALVDLVIFSGLLAIAIP